MLYMKQKEFVNSNRICYLPEFTEYRKQNDKRYKYNPPKSMKQVITLNDFNTCEKYALLSIEMMNSIGQVLLETQTNENEEISEKIIESEKELKKALRTKI